MIISRSIVLAPRASVLDALPKLIGEGITGEASRVWADIDAWEALRVELKARGVQHEVKEGWLIKVGGIKVFQDADL